MFRSRWNRLISICWRERILLSCQKKHPLRRPVWIRSPRDKRTNCQFLYFGPDDTAERLRQERRDSESEKMATSSCCRVSLMRGNNSLVGNNVEIITVLPSTPWKEELLKTDPGPVRRSKSRLLAPNQPRYSPISTNSIQSSWITV